MSLVLTSWKEIADYLGKGVRTVQRWERLQLGIPIRRPPNRQKGMVMAVSSELDAWIQAHSVRPSREESAVMESERLQSLLVSAEAEILELREQLDRLQNLYYAAVANGHAPDAAQQEHPAKRQGAADSSRPLSLNSKREAEDREFLFCCAQENRLRLLNSVIQLCGTYIEMAQTANSIGDAATAHHLLEIVDRTLSSRACHVDASVGKLHPVSRETFRRIAELQDVTRNMRQRLAEEGTAPRGLSISG